MEAKDPGENQGTDQAGAIPAEPASGSTGGPGVVPGNTPARKELTDYKKWYNKNRPGKRERAKGEVERPSNPGFGGP